ncbi:hypothetical protein OB955_14940 [Halobacteria archaeon AArc-m2/3/4]|uniref:Uncharacterized protein n=1 Tax=Natronoglomus mannanivorans TaxID=2979990 RepID=A0AAP3E3P3_9EURY|nr:hypothetical protein [Halobacteria archaeon AArc-xg1-1]MCU4974026.1 hypothetical protein [Halobacteria archaeon AArc-m2/3/4]
MENSVCRKHTKDSSKDTANCITRRKALSLGITGTALLSVPNVAAEQQDHPKRDTNQEPISIESEVIEETETYVLKHYSVNGDEYYLREYFAGKKEGTISILERSEIEERGNEYIGIQSVDRNSEISAQSENWTDYVVRYDRTDRTTYEVCADSDYGAHRWKGATIELVKAAQQLGSGVLAIIVDGLLEPLGIPGLGEVVGLIVGWLAGRAQREFTFGALDSDGWFDVKYISVRRSTGYDTDPFDTSQAGPPIPGFHLG